MIPTDAELSQMFQKNSNLKQYAMHQYNRATKEYRTEVIYARNKKEATLLGREWTLRFCTPLIKFVEARLIK